MEASAVGLATLHFLPAGRTPPNPGALLDSAAFRALLTDLTAAYDYVLFDVPPVLAVAAKYGTTRLIDNVRFRIQP